MQKMLLMALFASLTLTACQSTPDTATATPISAEPALMQFTPTPAHNREIDYSQVNELLRAFVMVTGPSIRERASLPDKPTNTRVYYGHTSPYRLEGNKIKFSDFFPLTKELVAEYVDSLVGIANTHDITRFSRNEQLAFWFNLHNLLVIKEIAYHYPVRIPASIEPNQDGITLNDAKLVTINQVPLSLKDIRTKIVYPNWRDPMVIYGFFHGDIASPNIRKTAYTGSNVQQNIRANAKEFVNSLRGVSNTFGPVEISPIYKEAKGLFTQWPQDFKRHAVSVAKKQVAGIITDTDTLKFARRESRIADLMGGMRAPSFQIINATSMGPEVAFQRAYFMREFALKQLILREREGSIGTVTVTDMDAQPTSQDGQ